MGVLDTGACTCPLSKARGPRPTPERPQAQLPSGGGKKSGRRATQIREKKQKTNGAGSRGPASGSGEGGGEGRQGRGGRVFGCVE